MNCSVPPRKPSNHSKRKAREVLAIHHKDLRHFTLILAPQTLVRLVGCGLGGSSSKLSITD